MQLQSLIEYLEKICPLELAEDWDNVGLSLGDRRQEVKNVLTCLTIDETVVDEAIAKGADCIVSHHPFPFHAAKKWTADTTDGKLLLKLAGAKIAVFSPHTAHDSALFGINRQLAEGLGLQDVRALYPGKLAANKEMLAGLDDSDAVGVLKDLNDAKNAQKNDSNDLVLGTGRIGRFAKPKKFSELIAQVKDMLQIERLLVEGDDGKLVRKVAIGCGAADDFVDKAVKEGADALLLGEAKFHACLEGRARGLGMIMAGHYATERFSMVVMAYRIAKQFPGLKTQASEKESDPIRIV